MLVLVCLSNCLVMDGKVEVFVDIMVDDVIDFEIDVCGCEVQIVSLFVQ